ncbi:hypothetical protein JQU24_09070 [Ponticoccus sp. SC6-38]|nr:hypothetical protein [Ponticoccus sp. SC6-38]MBM1277455.1 hypothetical protein [Ponticoccus sp. SC6-36]MBM1291575.1 hypothetical protein [Ponticoccus sp. SC6-11]
MVYVVPLLFLTGGLVLGVLCLRWGIGWLVVVLVLIAALLAAGAIREGRAVSGWDGIGYAIFAMLMMAPAILGLLLGAAIGLYRRRKSRHIADP